MQLLALAAIVGAGLSFFLDPTSGRRRRALLRDRTAGFFRRRSREAARLGRTASAEAYGLKQKATHLREEPKPGALNDPALARKVETEIFRDADVPKGQIDVSVENGVVVLRGEVPRSELVDDLVQKVRKVHGVKDVENLLHLPGTPAPMHQ